MHQADKAALRLAFGLGVSAVIAYGLAFDMQFLVCILVFLLVSNPGPPVPFVKGAVLAGVVTALVSAGMLLIPLLEHYALAAVMLVGVLLYAVFFTRKRLDDPKNVSPLHPLTTLSVFTITYIPVFGYADQHSAALLIQALAAGLLSGFLINIVAHALFPDPPGETGPMGKKLVIISSETAHWMAVRATLIMLPVFVLALTNPPFYRAAIMKTVTLAQRSTTVGGRSAGSILVGSTLMGAWMAMLVWSGLTMWPCLWMLMLWLMATGLWVGAKMFGARPTSFPPAFWHESLLTMLILLGPAIQDSATGRDVYRASAIRLCLLVGVALYAWATVWVLERWRASRSGTLSKVQIGAP